jgi:hypothetical protein
MVYPLVDRQRRPRNRRPAASALQEPRDDSCGGSLTLMRPAAQPTAWVDELVGLLRSEVDEAARRGLITAAESEQLVARLVLVIEQGMSTG